MTYDAIYLDHSATTPLRPEVREAMLPWLGGAFGNPGSIHRAGRAAKKAVEDARDQIAAFINADPRDIVFTATGTEADNMALRGACRARKAAAAVVSAVEHHAVLHCAEALAKEWGIQVAVLPVDAAGRAAAEAIGEFLAPTTAIVSVMHVNNETGVVQPVEAIGALCRERGVPFHVDAVQSAGKLALDMAAMPIDLLALSAHKLNGPQGAGALYIRNGVDIAPLVVGGAQERGRRAGTENVAAIVGFGAAAALAQAEREAESARVEALRRRFETGVRERIRGTAVSGEEARRAPHIANIRFEGVEGESILLALDMEGVAVSTGSACTAGSLDPSHVLLAMGLDHVHALSAVRFSFGYGVTEAHVDRVLDLLAPIVERLRGAAPLTPRS